MKKLVVFTQAEENCIYCKRYNPTLDRLIELGYEVEKIMAFTPEGEHNPLNAKYNIKSTPTSLIMEDDVVIEQFAGAFPVSYVKDKLK